MPIWRVLMVMTTHSATIKGLLGLVLCGGRATRMGGKDKGLIVFKNHPMAAYTVAALGDCQQVIINANRHQQIYAKQFQLPVVSDATATFDGPLAGMLAGLCYAKTHGFDWVICAACDAPFLNSDYVSTMWQAAQHSDAKILMAADKFSQPVFALLHVSLATALARFLQGEQKKILLFYQQIGYETVRFADSRLFVNINHPSELC